MCRHGRNRNLLRVPSVGIMNVVAVEAGPSEPAIGGRAASIVTPGRRRHVPVAVEQDRVVAVTVGRLVMSAAVSDNRILMLALLNSRSL